MPTLTRGDVQGSAVDLLRDCLELTVNHKRQKRFWPVKPQLFRRKPSPRLLEGEPDVFPHGSWSQHLLRNKPKHLNTYINLPTIMNTKNLCSCCYWQYNVFFYFNSTYILYFKPSMFKHIIWHKKNCDGMILGTFAQLLYSSLSFEYFYFLLLNTFGGKYFVFNSTTFIW